MPSSRPLQRFQDIIDNIDAITAYTAGIDRTRFLADRKTFDATERCLSRISEAAVKLGDLAAELAPGPPWKDIRGMGNRLRHEYPAINDDAIWKIVQSDLASLRLACDEAVRRLQHETSSA